MRTGEKFRSANQTRFRDFFPRFRIKTTEISEMRNGRAEKNPSSRILAYDFLKGGIRDRAERTLRNGLYDKYQDGLMRDRNLITIN